jgi:hypothetical protein
MSERWSGLAESWDDLVATAMLGTDRRPLPAPLGGPLGRFGCDGDPALALLDRAAATQAVRRAGALPEEVGAPLAPCSADPRLPCSDAAARRLGRMLDGGPADLLPEWLQTVRRHDLVAPPEHLVRLMDRTRPEPELHRLVVVAGGPLVGWMAGVLPGLGWVPSVQRDPLEVWERGTPADRLDALRLLRADDPAAARLLLAVGLPGERGELRASCYATLAIGLSPADEAVLEQALDDRSAAVREVAADLLARLPSSAWARRMSERALAMVRVIGPPGDDRLEIVPVAPIPPDWERDGVSAAAPVGSSLSVHALHQVIAGTPLDAWDAVAPGPHLVVLAAEHELGPVLVAAWSSAAVRQEDRGWARLLLDESGEPSLVSVVPPEDLRRLAGRSATAEAVLTPLALAAFEAVPTPWDAELRRVVGEAVVALFFERRVGRHQVPSLRRLVRALDPGVLADVADALAVMGLPPPIDGLRDDLVMLMRFRAEMLEEIVVSAS